MRIISVHSRGLLVRPDQTHHFFISDERPLPIHYQTEAWLPVARRTKPARVIGQQAILNIPIELAAQVEAAASPDPSVPSLAEKWLERHVLFDANIGMFAMLGTTRMEELVGFDEISEYAHKPFWIGSVDSIAPPSHPVESLRLARG